MFATALKDLAVELGIFVMTSTQVNANADNPQEIRNESTIAGSRAIINKADIGCVMARPTKQELEFLSQSDEFLIKTPTLVTDIYKVRSGEWNQVRIWSNVNLGNLRKEDLFVTDSRMVPVKVGLEFRLEPSWSPKMEELMKAQLKELEHINDRL